MGKRNGVSSKRGWRAASVKVKDGFPAAVFCSGPTYYFTFGDDIGKKPGDPGYQDMSALTPRRAGELVAVLLCQGEVVAVQVTRRHVQVMARAVDPTITAKEELHVRLASTIAGAVR